MMSTPISKDDAVSPVIGTILIIALTVVLVSISAVVFLGFGMAEPAPILGISIGQQGNVISVTHLNGAELPAGTYKIIVDGVDKTAEFGGTVNFGPGITLTWDSGTEAVETVSVVSTSDKGISTLLAEKTVGKAGSGGGADPMILLAAGQKYLISDAVWGGVWKNLRDEANATGSITLPNNNVYYDGEYHWWAITSFGVPPYTLSEAEAQTTSNITIFTELPQHDEWIKIDTSKVFTYKDGEWEGWHIVFKDNKPNTGALYCDNDTKLYVWAANFLAGTFDTTSINPYGWVNIGALVSS
jgi:porphobilinogen synthase